MWNANNYNLILTNSNMISLETDKIKSSDLHPDRSEISVCSD